MKMTHGRLRSSWLSWSNVLYGMLTLLALVLFMRDAHANEALGSFITLLN